MINYFFLFTLIYISIDNLDVSNVTDMSYMFHYMGNLAKNVELNLNGFDASNVTNMSYMFDYVGTNGKIIKLDLAEFNTTNVTNMSYMFYLTGFSGDEWNIGTFDIYASDISNMFYCTSSAIGTLNIHSNPTSYSSAFVNSASKEGAGITVNYSSNTTNIDNIIATKTSESNVIKGSQLD